MGDRAQSSPAVRVFLVLAVIILVLAGSILVVAPVRAAVFSWLGVSRTADQVVLQTPVKVTEFPLATKPAVLSTSNGDATPISKATPSPDLGELSQAAGWKVLQPGWLPDGYAFSGSVFDQQNNLVQLSFTAQRILPGSDSLSETRQITLTQARTASIIPLKAAPDTSVEEIMVGELPGAYALGGWDSEFVADSSEANGGHFEAAWNSSLKAQNIYWQSGDVALVLITDDPQISKRDLLAMAASVR